MKMNKLKCAIRRAEEDLAYLQKRLKQGTEKEHRPRVRLQIRIKEEERTSLLNKLEHMVGKCGTVPYNGHDLPAYWV